MSAICCPVCETTAEPAAAIGGLVVCAHCGASLVVTEADGTVRRATAADTTVLSAADLQILRLARKRTR